jgi:integrase
MRAKLEKFGIIQIEKDRSTETILTLGKHIDDYLTKRTDVKGSTKTNWGHTWRNLIAFFGDDKPLAEINAGDAKDFERYLKTEARENAYAGTEKDEGLRPDTVRKRISNAKLFFGDAVEHELIARNPFVGLKSSVIGNRDRDFFVTQEMTAKVLDACPDAQWRLMVTLSRFGGLRCPSELLALRLDSADWDAGRIRIDSPKTEHHDGKAYRIIPMFPELRPYLEDRWEQAEPGETHFIKRYAPGQNVGTHFARIIRRANLTPWPKLWQNMRATRQTELEEVFPSHVVCAWMGNSQQVARRHYLQVHDEHYTKAVIGARSIIVASKAPQDAANEKCDASETAQTSMVSQCVASSVGDAGLEPATSAL